MVCSTCPQHHVTITLSSHLVLALGMEKDRGGGEKSDVLGLQGHQGRLEISAVRMSTATTAVWSVSLCTPGLGGCLEGHVLEDWMWPLNQIPFHDNQTFPIV